jgi:hypothetical protein
MPLVFKVRSQPAGRIDLDTVKGETAFGYLAMPNNTAKGNTAIGMQSLRSNITARFNTAIGYQSMYSNTTGEFNTAVGNLSMLFNTSGTYNTAAGWNSLWSNTTGSNNTAFGVDALGGSVTGSSNTAIGYVALQDNTTGSSNTMVGYIAGIFNSTGSHNTVMGDTAYGSITGNYNVAIGTKALYAVCADSNTSIGAFSCAYCLGNRTTTVIGAGADAFGATANATAIGANAVVTCNNCMVLGNNANVGIGTSTPGYLLEVNGAAAKPGGGSWTATSDARLKEDITTYTDGLASLMQISPVRYRYNALSGYDTSRHYVGVIAQDLIRVAPYMVGTYLKDSTQYYNVDNSAMTYMIINSVKEQQKMIDEQNNTIRDMLTEIKALRAIVSKDHN